MVVLLLGGGTFYKHCLDAGAHAISTLGKKQALQFALSLSPILKLCLLYSQRNALSCVLFSSHCLVLRGLFLVRGCLLIS